MKKEELKKKLGKYWEDLKRDSKTNYIICPDMNCEGFKKEILQCKSRGTYVPGCPKKDLGYRILHCYHGHPNKLPLDVLEWRRIDCYEKDCGASNFNLMSGIYMRIPLELADEFLEKPFTEKK